MYARDIFARMRNLRSYPLIAAFAAATALLVASVRTDAQSKPAAPQFKVDPTWPQEMPNHWIMGAVTGVFVDSKQHVWVTHLPETLTEEELYEEPWNVVAPPAPAGGRGGAGAAAPAAPREKPVQIATCCKAAPPVLEFDQQGKLVQGWGQGSYDDMSNWPRE